MIIFPKTSCIDLSRDRDWLTVWLNLPEKRNALTQSLCEELRATFSALKDERSIRGVTLRGRGGVFCAGADLKQVEAALSSAVPAGDIADISRDISETLEMINKAKQPVIAIIDGAAIGGGFGLACCADFVIAKADAVFAVPGTQLGLSPAPVIPYILQRIRHSRARRIILTSERIDANEAVDIGLADFLFKTEDTLNAITTDLKRLLLESAPGALTDTKDLLHALSNQSTIVDIELAAENFAARLKTDEAREGAKAFIDKRPPTWAQNSKQS